MRRIPRKEVPERNVPSPEEEKENRESRPPPLQQMAPRLRRSPRLRPEREIDPEVRAQLRQEHRRKFEENLAEREEMAKQARDNIDARLRAALAEDSGSDQYGSPPRDSDCPSPDDAVSPDGPQTPPDELLPEPNQLALGSPSTWSREKQREIAAGLAEVYKPGEEEEQLPIGFGNIISRFAGQSKKEGKCLVLFTLEEIEHLKAFVELARIGLEMKDKKREERER